MKDAERGQRETRETNSILGKFPSLMTLSNFTMEN